MSGDEREGAWRTREFVQFTERGDEGCEAGSGGSETSGSGEVII